MYIYHKRIFYNVSSAYPWVMKIWIIFNFSSSLYFFNFLTNEYVFFYNEKYFVSLLNITFVCCFILCVSMYSKSKSFWQSSLRSAKSCCFYPTVRLLFIFYTSLFHTWSTQWPTWHLYYLIWLHFFLLSNRKVIF